MLQKLLSSKSTKREIDNYRQFYLQSDIKQAKIGILLFAFPIAAFVFNDYQFLNLSNEFFVLAALRLGLLLFSIFEFKYIEKVKDFRIYDRTVSLGAIVFMVIGGIINATRPQNFIVQVIITNISIFVLFLIIQNRFLNQVLLSSMLTFGETAIIVLFLHPTDIPTIFTIFLSLIMANIIAILSAWHVHSYRKKSYQDYVKSKKLQISLEQHTKHLEKLVEERTEKLKEAERLSVIGATAGMVGHDIRNPLTSITGAVYLAKKDLGQIPESEAKDRLTRNIELIGEETLYVNKIVEDLQDYSRPIKPVKEKINLYQIIHSIIDSLKIPKNVILKYTIGESSKNLKSDAAFIRRIVTNLANNAVQAMPQGGTLIIETKLEIGKLLITVEDSGEGIPEEARAKLFVPLFTTKSKGQGFGLAVTKRLIEAMDGTISFESEVGKGTKFLITIPIHSS